MVGVGEDLQHLLLHVQGPLPPGLRVDRARPGSLPVQVDQADLHPGELGEPHLFRTGTHLDSSDHQEIFIVTPPLPCCCCVLHRRCFTGNNTQQSERVRSNRFSHHHVLYFTRILNPWLQYNIVKHTMYMLTRSTKMTPKKIQRQKKSTDTTTTHQPNFTSALDATCIHLYRIQHVYSAGEEYIFSLN